MVGVFVVWKSNMSVSCRVEYNCHELLILFKETLGNNSFAILVMYLALSIMYSQNQHIVQLVL